ncbi:Increased sodium tolerance protein 1 [Wickerhamomyces ciferrii]|uniref:Increased sodium tolerance protein 1 n=1 Tax=Wickerhamomyces ciferrii (strain ATCC 14091 / BCRC 22168 / CBS 111 / JCM 3599 / NBRC 0793 / NRRL Y-1031 F-60-10) TaxID=1206466 RepID=K0KX73_WICCF|nr:Increased sodium tolerance protein 1 [Wickerhamomyces ciferrii]CCH46084.1 Increased sodium tolerance protein 1 [Wickerhamomyces ciferrii]
MAELLSLGKEESAKIRVENIVREDIYVELLEMLELYCELLLARIGLLDKKECDPGLEEAVKTIIYSAPHTDLKEVNSVRDILIHKFGAEFARSAIENEDNVIPEKITKRTAVEAPSQELVSLYLKEIAKAYEVPFSELDDEIDNELEDLDEDDEDDDDEGGSGKPIQLEEPLEDYPETERMSTPRKLSAHSLPNPNEVKKSPISIRPPHKSSDNPNPSVKIPDDVQKNVTKKKRPSDVGTKPTTKEDNDLDALRKRFEALKR